MSRCARVSTPATTTSAGAPPGGDVVGGRGEPQAGAGGGGGPREGREHHQEHARGRPCACAARDAGNVPVIRAVHTTVPQLTVSVSTRSKSGATRKPTRAAKRCGAIAASRGERRNHATCDAVRRCGGHAHSRCFTRHTGLGPV